jgi:transposase
MSEYDHEVELPGELEDDDKREKASMEAHAASLSDKELIDTYNNMKKDTALAMIIARELFRRGML